MSHKKNFFRNRGDVYSDLVAEYKFEDNFNDAINGYNGTEIGTVPFTTDLVNKCVSFSNSETNRIDINSNSDLLIVDGSGNYTNFSWTFMFNIIDLTHRNIITKRSPPSTTGNVEYLIAVSADSKITILVYGYSNPTTNFIQVKGSTTISVGVSYNVGISFNPSLLPSNPFKIFLNGLNDTDEASFNKTGSPTGSSSWGNILHIGCNYDLAIVSELEGNFDEFYMYRRNLSQSDFLKIYNINQSGNSI
jgi:hypothetical protein